MPLVKKALDILNAKTNLQNKNNQGFREFWWHGTKTMEIFFFFLRFIYLF